MQQRIVVDNNKKLYPAFTLIPAPILHRLKIVNSQLSLVNLIVTLRRFKNYKVMTNVLTNVRIYQ